MFYTSKIPKFSNFTPNKLPQINCNIFGKKIEWTMFYPSILNKLTLCIQMRTNSNHFVKSFNNSGLNLLN